MTDNLLEAPFLIPSLIFLIASIPLVLGLVPRNRYYGIRTAKTLSDDDAWVTANRFGGLTFILSSLIYLGMALLFPYRKSAPDNFSVWGIHLVVFTLPIAAGIFITLRRVKRL